MLTVGWERKRMTFMKGERSQEAFENRLLHKGLLARVFLAIFIPAAVFVGSLSLLPKEVQAAECPATPFSASGYFFNSYESLEYSPDGHPIQHLKVNYADGRQFRLTWSYYDDECNSASVTGNQVTISLPAGVSNWSVRVVSPTRIEIWNDQNNTAITGFDIPAYPAYTSIAFGGTIDGGASTFGTRKLKMNQSGEPPVFTGTLPKPEACASVADGTIGGSNPYFFDSYEHAEYVDGFLRVHLRLKTPRNDGRPFRSGIATGDENCTLTSGALSPLGTAITQRVRYFSFRMISETDWQLWDDENNQPLTCSTCSGSLPAGAKFVQWFGSVDNGASTISTTPFAPVEVAPEPVYAECCSSVVFLPGIQSSVLKKGTDILWPPTFGDVSGDLSALMLNPDGTAVTPDVEVSGILQNFDMGPISVPIYSGFSSFMNALVANTGDDINIREWKALPYDWRFSPEKILQDGVQTPSGTMYLLDEIERVALDSATGKVTIVTHSMGGLMGKAIIKALEEQEKADLVDSFVMVGTPQLGTPESIPGLLHGDGADISYGPFSFINKAQARTLGSNMQAAYNLLPSSTYLSTVIDPVVVFDNTTPITQNWRNQWGLSLGNLGEFYQFLSGNVLGIPVRSQPSYSDTQNPSVLKTHLLANADAFHAEFDSYVFPPSIRVVQIAGWGLDTLKGIEYTEDDGVIDFIPRFTTEGDSTVVYPSAVSSFGEVYYFNLDIYGDVAPDTEHRDFLSSNPILDVIKEIISKGVVSTASYISAGKPNPADVQDRLLVGVHSPLTLGVFDNLGRFTGIDESISDLEIQFTKKEIPGSKYFSFGEGKYVILPDGGTYNFKFKGTGTGTATINVERISNDTVSEVISYVDVPVSEGVLASFVIENDSSNLNLEIDLNADGQVDTYVAAEGQVLTLTELLVNLKTVVQNLSASEKFKRELLKRVDRIEKKIGKQKNKKATKTVMNLEKKIAKKSEKGEISSTDAQEVLNLLEQIENAI
ncbi:hypothetical protein K2P56_02895 [Patescibacteria group bacterium]|nr:hypothetical protein [Patescibacteria group bacterium]